MTMGDNEKQILKERFLKLFSGDSRLQLAQSAKENVLKIFVRENIPLIERFLETASHILNPQISSPLTEKVSNNTYVIKNYIGDILKTGHYLTWQYIHIQYKVQGDFFIIEDISFK